MDTSTQLYEEDPTGSFTMHIGLDGVDMEVDGAPRWAVGFAVVAAGLAVLAWAYSRLCKTGRGDAATMN